MTIDRIESLVFGVQDITACERFFTDAGLDRVEMEPARVVFRTPENQTIVLKDIDDPSLPKAMESGSTLREIVWGVSNWSCLDVIASDLVRDRAVTTDIWGTVHSNDETGFGIAFKVSDEQRLPASPEQPSNTLRQIHRLNERLTRFPTPRPLRLIHIAMNIPEAGHDEAVDFYIKRLKFRATDQVLDSGTFMRCDGDIEHHNFFLCHRPNAAGFNHFAMEFRNFDELIQAGNRMVGRHWKEARTLGRHLLGSNLYRFFHCPAGARVEFASDMDRMDDTFETRVWPRNPGHHIWSLKSSGQPAE